MCVCVFGNMCSGLSGLGIKPLCVAVVVDADEQVRQCVLQAVSIWIAELRQLAYLAKISTVCCSEKFAECDVTDQAEIITDLDSQRSEWGRHAVEAAQRTAAGKADAEQAACVQAEKAAEINCQRVEVERLALEDVQRAVAVQAAVQEAARVQAETLAELDSQRLEVDSSAAVAASGG